MRQMWDPQLRERRPGFLQGICRSAGASPPDRGVSYYRVLGWPKVRPLGRVRLKVKVAYEILVFSFPLLLFCPPSISVSLFPSLSLLPNSAACMLTWLMLYATLYSYCIVCFLSPHPCSLAFYHTDIDLSKAKVVKYSNISFHPVIHSNWQINQVHCLRCNLWQFNSVSTAEN